MNPTPAPSTSRPLRRRLLWIGIPAFLVLLIVSLPAGLAVRVATAVDPRIELTVPRGSFWSGRARLRFDGRDLGELDWTFTSGALTRGRLGVDLALTDPAHQAGGRITLGVDGRLHGTAVDVLIREPGLEALLAPYAILPSGRVEMEDGRFEARLATGGSRLVAADARARWSGGPVRYQLGGRNWFADFPPLDAELEAADGQPRLVVRDRAGQDLLDVRVDGAGWAHLRLRYGFVRLAGFPWPDPPATDAVVIEISEQIL